MLKIILYGWDNGRKDLLRRNLSAFFKVTIPGEDKMISYGRGEELILSSYETAREIYADPCLLIVQEKANLKKIRKISKQAMAVFHSEQSEQLAELVRLGIPVIPCGMSLKDTVTFSSLAQEEAVVALQRSIPSLYGDHCEPMEIHCCVLHSFYLFFCRRMF